jgi:ankyrin repeat protein
MPTAQPRRRVAVASALVVTLVAVGCLTFPHLQRAQRSSELIAAVYSGDRNKVQQLLDRGFDPNSANLNGFKPLMRAVTVPPQLANPEVVQLLENKLSDKVVSVLKNNGAKRASELR